MRIPRFYCPQSLSEGETLTLSKDLSHYLGRVLRLKEGATIVLFNGEGGEYTATIQRLDKSSTSIQTHTFRDPHTDSQLPIHLLQGISRGERMQYVIQKAAELGAAGLQPIFTDYCEVKLANERAEKKQEHWQSLANSACEQCGRTKIMIVHSAIKLVDWLARNSHKHTSHLRLTLDPYSQTALGEIQTAIDTVTLLIGPEGGLSSNEVALAKQHGFIGVQLGPRILRTETATAAALTAIHMTWGDFNPL